MLKPLLFLSIVLSLTRVGLEQDVAANCAKPSVLRVTKRGTDLWYQLDGNKAHKLFTLGEVSQVIGSCPTEKMLFVIADPNIPISKLMLPGKEQITKVRYFLRYGTGEVQEISFALLYPKIPFSSDVIGYPPYDDTPPTLVQKAKGRQ
jgi:hypothetical protein